MACPYARIVDQWVLLVKMINGLPGINSEMLIMGMIKRGKRMPNYEC